MDAPLKPYKRDFDYSYALGVFPTLELLHARPGSLIRVLVSARGGRNKGALKLGELCRRRRVPVEVNDRAIERLSPKENTYAIGVFRKYTDDLDAAANHVALVNPGDMGNLGAIARTMLGFGVKDLTLVRPAADIFDPKVVRASMGAVFRLRCRYFDSFEQYRTEAGPRALYPFMTGGSTPLTATTFQPPFTLIFGNESSGLPPEYQQVGQNVTIRHSPEIDSLSLPMAVGISLYEATR